MSSAPGMSAAHGHVVVDRSMSSGAAELGQWDFHLAVAPVRFAGCSAARVRHEAREASGFTQAGWHASCLPWLHEREVALIGADTPWTFSRRVERGPGFVTASAVDPFGNVLGVV
jgi:kynurenine formamidase